jgi:hypothetical protein
MIARGRRERAEPNHLKGGMRFRIRSKSSCKIPAFLIAMVVKRQVRYPRSIDSQLNYLPLISDSLSVCTVEDIGTGAAEPTYFGTELGWSGTRNGALEARARRK